MCVCVSVHVYVSLYFIQMGRNLFSDQQPEVSLEVSPLPGSASPAAQQSGARIAFVPLQGLASSPRIPLSHINHREAWNRGRELFHASNSGATHTLLSCPSLWSRVPLTLFWSCLTSLSCPWALWLDHPLTPDRPSST